MENEDKGAGVLRMKREYSQVLKWNGEKSKSAG